MFISGIALLEQKLCFTTTFRVFLFKKGCNMNLKGIIFLSISGILSLFLFQSTLFSQPVEVPFGSGQWDMSRAQVIEHLGRTAIKGNAMLRDIRFTNGIIEVDIATTERTRAYPGVLFRVQDPSNYERVYIRPHRSPFYSDALQYAPVFHGVDSWQLYNGPGKTCALDILPDQWNHLKIVVSGTRAEVFWNGNKRPDLTIGELAHGDIPGTLGLNGGMDSPCFFSGFSYLINNVAIDARGNLYITDTPLNRLYRYSADTLETILNEDILNGPNGLLIDGNHLLIGQNEEILKLDLTSRAVTSIAKFEPGSNIDGIQSDGRGNYLVSDYGGKLYRLTPDGNKILLLNTSTPGLTLADFSYIPEKKRLIIPTLYNNSVVCFELK